MGGIIEGIGQAQAMEAQAKADDMNASIAQANKVVANQNRKTNLDTSHADYLDSLRASRRNTAAIRAAFGNSGFSGGSQLDVLADTASEQNLSSIRIADEGRTQNRKGALQMLGFENDTELAKLGAASNRAGEGLAILGGFVNTVTDVISFGK